MTGLRLLGREPHQIIASGLIALISLATSYAHAAQVRGLLVFGHEVRTLQPCGDDRIFWLDVPDNLREPVEARYQAVASRPYQAVCAVIEGTSRNQPSGAFAADYDGAIVLSELHSISTVDADDCCLTQPVGAARQLSTSEETTYVFVCEDYPAYTVRTTETAAWVFLPEGTLQLPIMPVEQGVKFSDASFELLIDGEQARFGKPDGTCLTCQNDRYRAVWEHAKLNGADFRAVGNEPGWHLEIREGNTLVLIADYGASRFEQPLPEPTVEPDARRTRWDTGELILEVMGRPCLDSMSGERFESQVVVTWGERILKGCGRALH